jgi:hypothetical protein
MRTIHNTHLCGLARRHVLTFGITLGIVTPAVSVAQGIAEPWDVTVAAQNMARQAARLQPLLDQLTPLDWPAGPATATYIRQLQSARDEVRYLVGAAQTLGQQPEKLSVAFETYFRLQSVENQVQSLAEGVRRYQNPAVGDSMISVMAANGANRDQLRQYISDLSQTREQEFKVADGEAQRCRGMLMRQPAAAPAPAAPPAAATPGANQPKGSR